MYFLVTAIITLIIVLILKFVLDINFKNIKKIAENDILDEKTKKYPSNKEICKWYLKKLNNENVQIEENESKQTCLHSFLSN